MSPSRLPNELNGCQYADNTLVLTLTPSDPATGAPDAALAVTKLGPLTGSLLPASRASDAPVRCATRARQPLLACICTSAHLRAQLRIAHTSHLCSP
jgi:hypothetical protein